MNEFTCNYPNFRAYGQPPYKMVLILGGLGAPEEMEPVSKKRCEISGTLKPLQKETSIENPISSHIQKALKR